MIFRVTSSFKILFFIFVISAAKGIYSDLMHNVQLTVKTGVNWIKSEICNYLQFLLKDFSERPSYRI